MQIKGSKTQNFDWEPGFSDSAPLNCVKWPGSPLLPPNASNLLIEGLFSELPPGYYQDVIWTILLLLFVMLVEI